MATVSENSDLTISTLVPPGQSTMTFPINSMNTLNAGIVPHPPIKESTWYELPEMNSMMDIFYFGLSMAVVFGGLVPYIPQYIKIKRIANSEGFSTYVCLTLLIANILRILFWFGHKFETPLLLQSFVMVTGMLAMMELCIRVKKQAFLSSNEQTHRMLAGASTHNETDPIYSVSSSPVSDESESNADPLLSPVIQIIYNNSTSNNSFFNIKQFWQWIDLITYLEFLVSFTLVASLVTYLMIDNNLYVESLGFLAVFIESLLGMPQLLKNFSKKSTRGMSVEMVVMWLSGDIFKTSYFLIRHTPAQFWICGTIQIVVDIFILFQSFYYGSSGPYHKLPKTY